MPGPSQGLLAATKFQDTCSCMILGGASAAKQMGRRGRVQQTTCKKAWSWFVSLLSQHFEVWMFGEVPHTPNPYDLGCRPRFHCRQPHKTNPMANDFGSRCLSLSLSFLGLSWFGCSLACLIYWACWWTADLIVLSLQGKGD